MLRQYPVDNIQRTLYHSERLVRIYRLQVDRRYFILRVDRMSMDFTACIFLTLNRVYIRIQGVTGGMCDT